jgi:hypothetical protein
MPPLCSARRSAVALFGGAVPPFLCDLPELAVRRHGRSWEIMARSSDPCQPPWVTFAVVAPPEGYPADTPLTWRCWYCGTVNARNMARCRGCSLERKDEEA